MVNARLGRLLLVVAFLIGPPLVSCPICLSGGPRPLTVGEQLIAAETIAVAAFVEDRTYEVREVLREGESGVDKRFEDPSGYKQERLLAVRVGEPAKWKILGPYDPALEPLVQRCLPLSPLKEAGDEAWNARLDLFEKDLGHEDYRIGSSAWAAWATAPYHILARRKSVPTEAMLLEKAQARERPMEKALWWSLLSHYPSDECKAVVRAGLEQAWKYGGTENLAPLLSTHLVHEGNAAIGYLQKNYLRDPARSQEEVRMAVLALGLYASEFKPQRRVAHRVLLSFVKERPHLSGLVAPFLAEWKDFSLEEHYRALVTRGDPRVPGDTRALMTAYLKACDEARGKP